MATIGKTMQNKRNLIQIWLLCAAMLPAVVQAQFIFTTNSDGSLNISQYTGSGGAVVIPSTTNDLPITSIGNGAFAFQDSLTGVTISDGVTSIGVNAFNQCYSLTNVAIGNNVTNIGIAAFQLCGSLTNVMIPDSVTVIGDYAFNDCVNLTNVMIGMIGNGATSIGDYAFRNCGTSYNSLMSIMMGNSVISIGDGAFEYCHLTSVTIPNSVTSIGSQAFYECILTNVIIGNGVTSIGDDAFEDCHLISVTIPSSVTNIGNAFEFCSGLTAVYFLGNAPLSYRAFLGDNQAIAYYLPGTTGWGKTYGNGTIRVVLWNPQAQSSGASFGVRTNRFGFNIAGSSNLVIVVEACTDLATPVWTAIGTNKLNTFIGTNGTSYFSDPQWTNYPGRFYRLRSP